MPKSSYKKIKEDEKKLMLELRKNSNNDMVRMAKSCRFSRQKIWRLINKLEKNESIWGYTAMLDNERLGLKKYLVLIKRTTKPMLEDVMFPLVKGGIEKDAKELGVEIESNMFVHGSYDWVITVVTTDIVKVKKFCNLLNRKLVGFASNISVLEVLFPAKENNVDNPDPEQFKTLFL